jgi:ankyrin repeat protein
METQILETLLDRHAQLLQAARSGDSVAVSSIFAAEPDDSCRAALATCAEAGSGMHALHYAACSGHLAIAQTLLDNGADIDAHDNDGATPLSLAAWGAQLPAVRLLAARGAKLDAPIDDWGTRAIHAAAGGGSLEALLLLLDLGADIETRDSNGWTPLHHAAWGEVGGRMRAIRALVERGANMRGLTNDNSTPLLLAMRFQRYEHVQALLENGAPPNEPLTLEYSDGGRASLPPLHYAVSRSEGKIVAALLSHGADAGATDARGRHAHYYLAFSPKTDDALSPILELLLQHGAKAAVATDGGSTFMRAYGNSSPRCAILLARAGAALGGGPREALVGGLAQLLRESEERERELGAMSAGLQSLVVGAAAEMRRLQRARADGGEADSADRGDDVRPGKS